MAQLLKGRKKQRRRTKGPAAHRPLDAKVGETRTVALVGHRSAGKTSLGDLLLWTTGVTRDHRRVDHENSLLDHNDDERRKRMSLLPAYAWLEWHDTTLQLIDTPGSDPLATTADVAALGADAELVVVDASAGLERGTEHALERVVRGRIIPRLVVVTKLDRQMLDGAARAALMAQLSEASGRRVVELQLPFADDEGAFAGYLCPFDRLANRYDPDATGTRSVEPVPERHRAQLDALWEGLVEAVAMTDDDLLERYLEEFDLPPEVVRAGLATATHRGMLLPVLYLSSTRAIGADALMNAIVRLVPPPLHADRSAWLETNGCPASGFTAQILSTHKDKEGHSYRVVRVWSGPGSAEPWLNLSTGVRKRVNKLYRLRGPRRSSCRIAHAGALVAVWEGVEGRPGDTLVHGAGQPLPLPLWPPAMSAWMLTDRPQGGQSQALESALHDLIAFDRGLELHADSLNGKLLLAGRSEHQLHLAWRRLRRWYDLDVHHQLPPVAYRETPATLIRDIEGVHVKEAGDGLVEEYGACRLDLAPRPPEQGNHFDADPHIDEEELPKRYVQPIGEGALEAMSRGPTAGYPVVGAEVCLKGGEYDILQSTDDHFRLAGAKALREALRRSGTRLLEPWNTLEVVCPADALGPLLAEISIRRGRVKGMEVLGRAAHVQASMPFREIRTFGASLQSITNGKGTFDRAHEAYQPLPDSLVDEAVKSSPFRVPDAK
jgi:elongation factor G